MRLLTMITSITPSFDLLEPLMESLISILQNAEVSLEAVQCSLNDTDQIVVADEDPLYANPQFGILPEPLPTLRIVQGQSTRYSR